MSLTNEKETQIHDEDHHPSTKNAQDHIVIADGMGTGPSEIAAASPVPEIQDGGFRAWLQVLGCFFLWFNLWGYTFAFGTFQNFYEQRYLPDTPASAIAWIGSIQSFLLIISCLWTGPIYDWGYYM